MLRHFPTFASLLGVGQATPQQSRSLLRLIAAAAEERIELAPLLLAWSEEHNSLHGLRLERLAESLSQGVPLADAVERHRGLLDDEDVLLIRCGTQLGMLPAMIRRRLTDQPLTNDEPTSRVRLVTCVFVLLAVMTPVMLFIQHMISPSILLIFNDFEIETPYVMQLASVLSGLPLLFFLVFVALTAAIVLTRFSGWPGNFVRRSVAPRLFATVRSWRIGAVLRRMGESAASGRPLPGAISTLARYHYDPALRHKLLFVRNELELGAELWPTLQSAGLITQPEATALDAADQTATRGWTLAAIGDARLSQATRRLRIQSGLLVPAVTLVFAAIVLIQVLSVFVPMVSLINNLS
ncbi:MAG: type II secretion system F family protein [Planctomycetota bacterium]